MTTKLNVRTLACTTLTLLPLVALGCGGDPVTASGPQGLAGATAPAAMNPAVMPPASQTPSTDAPPAKPADTSKPGDAPAKPADPAKPTQPTMPPASTPGNPPSTDPAKPSTMPTDPGADYPDLRGKCSIKSNYPGDEACISAPAPEEGMQIHIGPKDYTNTAEVARYIMEPGGESSLCWTIQTPNDADIVYQGSVLSGRAGTHHIINTMYPAGAFPESTGFARCGDSSKAIGSLPGASKAYMPRTHVAPEYADVGRSIPAKAILQSDMHYFNFTDKPIVREYWMNIYFAKKEDIKREALQIRGMGGFSWSTTPIAPGTNMVYKYECPVKGNGHILNLLGHYHAHGKRFTAYITKKGTSTPEKVFEMFDYLEPAVFEYNTVVNNPKFAEGHPGAVSGQLPISDGDVLSWECHIINDSDVGLRYINEVKTGEMCNLWGSSLGIDKWNCLKQ